MIKMPAIARRLRTMFAAAVLSAAVILPAGLFAATGAAAHVPSGGNDCSRWASTTQPPNYIRVLRHKSGRIVRVPFKRYVVVVLGKEWPSYLPDALVHAGAVAVKQYAWYHVLRGPRRTPDGRCFDVRDGTRDQLFKPHKSRVRPIHHEAVEATWGVSLLKKGKLFMTGYRRGSKHRCGRDATGWKLFALSGVRCAYSGKSYIQILRIYYAPHLTIRT